MLFVVLVAVPATAQQAAKEAEIKRAAPFSAVVKEYPGLTEELYNAAVSELARQELGGAAQASPLGAAGIPGMPAIPGIPGGNPPQLKTTPDATPENLTRPSRPADVPANAIGANAETRLRWSWTTEPQGSQTGATPETLGLRGETSAKPERFNFGTDPAATPPRPITLEEVTKLPRTVPAPLTLEELAKLPKAAATTAPPASVTLGELAAIVKKLRAPQPK